MRSPERSREGGAVEGAGEADRKPAGRPHRIGAAALTGSGMGALLGAFYLGYQSVAGFGYQCVDMTPDECELNESMVHDLARWQGMIAFALVTAALAAFFYLRASARRQQ